MSKSNEKTVKRILIGALYLLLITMNAWSLNQYDEYTWTDRDVLPVNFEVKSISDLHQIELTIDTHGNTNTLEFYLTHPDGNSDILSIPSDFDYQNKNIQFQEDPGNPGIYHLTVTLLAGGSYQDHDIWRLTVDNLGGTGSSVTTNIEGMNDSGGAITPNPLTLLPVLECWSDKTTVPIHFSLTAGSNIHQMIFQIDTGIDQPANFEIDAVCPNAAGDTVTVSGIRVGVPKDTDGTSSNSRHCQLTRTGTGEYQVTIWVWPQYSESQWSQCDFNGKITNAENWKLEFKNITSPTFKLVSMLSQRRSLQGSTCLYVEADPNPIALNLPPLFAVITSPSGFGAIFKSYDPDTPPYEASEDFAGYSLDTGTASLTYSWNYEYGSPGTGEDPPAHTFGAGIWDVTLTVGDEKNQTAKAVRRIIVNNAPDAVITFPSSDPAYYTVDEDLDPDGNTVDFNGSGFDNDPTLADALSYTWVYVNSSAPSTPVEFSYSENPDPRILSAGENTITFTVKETLTKGTDTYIREADHTITVYVDDPPVPTMQVKLPGAAGYIDALDPPAKVYIGRTQSIEFRYTVVDEDPGSVTPSWTFGGGTPDASEDAQAAVQFNVTVAVPCEDEDNVFTVSLEVTDNTGQKATDILQIVVKDPPTADIQFDGVTVPAEGFTAPVPLRLTLGSANLFDPCNDPNLVTGWSVTGMANGFEQEGTTSTYVFSKPGEYTAELSVKDSHDIERKITRTIYALPDEHMYFTGHIGVPFNHNPPYVNGEVSADDMGQWQEDVGWRGAYKLTYEEGTAPRVVFQGIRDNSANKIYLSFEVENDEDLSPADVIVMGFRPDPDAADPEINDRLVYIYPFEPDGDNQVVVYRRESGSWGVIPQANEPTGLIFAKKSKAVTVGSVTQYAWNVEVEIPTSAGSDWVNFDDKFLFYFNLFRAAGSDVVEAHWPRELEDLASMPELERYQFDPKWWGHVDLASGVDCNGLSLSHYSQIGVAADPAHPEGNLTSSIRYRATGNDINNVFVAQVYNDWHKDEYEGSVRKIRMLPGNQVRVRFKIANWGIPSDLGGEWEDITPNTSITSIPNINPTAYQDILPPGLPDEQPINPEDFAQYTSTGIFRMNWVLDPDDMLKYTPDLIDADNWNENHQCMLVEIESQAGANIVTKSVHRNMNFNAESSEFSHRATVSARGYGKPAGGASRHKFILKISAREWAVHPDQVRDYKPESTAEKKSQPDNRNKKNQGSGQKHLIAAGRPYPHLDSLLPVIRKEHEKISFLEYIVTGYLHTGNFVIIKGKKYDLLKPVGSYGHVVRHVGPVEEWRFGIEGAEKINENTYSLSIIPEQTASIVDHVEAVPPPKWEVHLHGGGAVPLGTFADDNTPGVNVLVGLGYHIVPQFSVIGLFGYNYLWSKTQGVDGTNLFNISLNARYHKTLTGPLSLYIGAGPGLYIDSTSGLAYGVNACLGLDIRLIRLLALELGADYHFIIPSRTHFVHSHFGMVFRF